MGSGTRDQAAMDMAQSRLQRGSAPRASSSLHGTVGVWSRSALAAHLKCCKLAGLQVRW